MPRHRRRRTGMLASMSSCRLRCAFLAMVLALGPLAAPACNVVAGDDPASVSPAAESPASAPEAASPPEILAGTLVLDEIAAGDAARFDVGRQ